MKKIIYLVLIVFVFVSCKSKQILPTTTKTVTTTIVNPTVYANTITQSELKEMLYTYASDEFEGRETGQVGQKKAVNYLKKNYKDLKIASAISNNYLQTVPLETLNTPQVSLSVNGKVFNYFEDFISLTSTSSLDIETKTIVYANYGIHTNQYSDYETLDVKNKVVVVKTGEPKDDSGNYVISGNKDISKWSNGRQSLASKRDAAKNLGAKAVILIDEEGFLFYRYSTYFKQIHERGTNNKLALTDENEKFLFLFSSNTLGNAILNNTTKRGTVKSNFDLSYKKLANPLTSENVIAYIKGNDKPNEYIILSAHLDHEGVKDGAIYNGADDDGSGTIALLEIAEAFKEAQKNGHGPKRSVVFLHVTAEEKGLLGSRYYTDHDPVFPLEQTVANLNIDMIGRTNPKREKKNRDYVYLIGSDKLSTELHNLSEDINDKYTNLDLDYTYNDDNDPNRFYYRSDHYNFAKHNIPVIFYFNGTHDDYHKPTDTADKIQYDLLQQRTKLIFYTAWELANRKDKVIIDKPISTP